MCVPRGVALERAETDKEEHEKEQRLMAEAKELAIAAARTEQEESRKFRAKAAATEKALESVRVQLDAAEQAILMEKERVQKEQESVHKLTKAEEKARAEAAAKHAEMVENARQAKLALEKREEQLKSDLHSMKDRAERELAALHQKAERDRVALEERAEREKAEMHAEKEKQLAELHAIREREVSAALVSSMSYLDGAPGSPGSTPRCQLVRASAAFPFESRAASIAASINPRANHSRGRCRS